jgi:outer membrane protein TolC
VQAALAARDFQQQSVDAEFKKLHLGASTSSAVLLQERNLATAENTLITANATYAKDRAGLYQILSTTLQHYGINLSDAASGNVTTTPVVPGVSPAKETAEPAVNPSTTPQN